MQKETKVSSGAKVNKTGKGQKSNVYRKGTAVKAQEMVGTKTRIKPVTMERKPAQNKLAAKAGGAETYSPSTSIEKFRAIREGLPYTAIENLARRLNTPVKSLLPFFEMPQTTYNLKKRNEETLGRRDSEMILYLNELIDYGIEVFDDDEETFLSWLRKSNLSLGGVTPESLLDSLTGIREVKGCLDRIEFGNMA